LNEKFKEELEKIKNMKIYLRVFMKLQRIMHQEERNELGNRNEEGNKLW